MKNKWYEFLDNNGEPYAYLKGIKYAIHYNSQIKKFSVPIFPTENQSELEYTVTHKNKLIGYFKFKKDALKMSLKEFNGLGIIHPTPKK